MKYTPLKISVLFVPNRTVMFPPYRAENTSTCTRTRVRYYVLMICTGTRMYYVTHYTVYETSSAGNCSRVCLPSEHKNSVVFKNSSFDLVRVHNPRKMSRVLWPHVHVQYNVHAHVCVCVCVCECYCSPKCSLGYGREGARVL
jgi:hypothetical protein